MYVYIRMQSFAEAGEALPVGCGVPLTSSSGDKPQDSLHRLKSRRTEALATIWSPGADVSEASMRWLMREASSSWSLHDLAKSWVSYEARASRMLSGMLDSVIKEKNSAAIDT